MDSHNDAIEALQHARSRLDRLARVEKQLQDSERARALAEAELAALGTEVMYCVDCATPFRYIPGVHPIEYCFTCLGKHAITIEQLEEQIAELHREIEFIDSPVVVSLIGARRTIAATAAAFKLREFGWLLCLMATNQRHDVFDDNGPEFCCSDATPVTGCWGDSACEGCGGCPLHCACEGRDGEA